MGKSPENLKGLESERPPIRIVVTGMGAVTPLGLNVPDLWKNVIEGRSGISEVEFPHTRVKVAGIIRDFDPEKALSGIVHNKDLKKLSRPAQFAIAAAYEALNDSGLLNEEKKLVEGIDSDRFGTMIGTGIGGAASIIDSERKLSSGKRVHPSDLLSSEPERVSTAVSMVFGLRGAIEAPTAACATGNVAASNGIKEILLGDADIMIVGGSEACLHEVTLSLFESGHALSLQTDPKTASKPYNKHRDGFVMSEGAGVYIIESLEHAKKRKAKIYAEIGGYGNTADAYHDTSPSIDGQRRAIRKAMKNAGKLNGNTIYINGHGTSTVPGDPAELTAIREELPHIKKAVSSTKSEMGHMVGAAGAVEGIFAMKALAEGVFPPTINVTDPIEEAEDLNLIPNEAQMIEGVEIALNESFGFGGMNSVIRYDKFKE
jgi:3-oxoacyl-[acyl-carrier-protein] synthase II